MRPPGLVSGVGSCAGGRDAEAMLHGWRRAEARGLQDSTIGRGSGWCGRSASPTSTRGAGAGPRRGVDAVAARSGGSRRRRSAATRPACGCSASTSATPAAAGRPARRRSGRGRTRAGLPRVEHDRAPGETRAARRPARRPRGAAAVPDTPGSGRAAATSGRKGALAAYRDATLFKVIYGWGRAAPRRRSSTWPTGAATRRRRSRPVRELHVRYGKAVRGSRRGGATCRR